MESPHDLVITDVLMPEMDGLEIVAHLRRAGSSSLVLVISGGWKDETIDVLDVAKKLGANRILSKADIVAKLVPTVDDMLRAKSAGP